MNRFISIGCATVIITVSAAAQQTIRIVGAGGVGGSATNAQAPSQVLSNLHVTASSNVTNANTGQFNINSGVLVAKAGFLNTNAIGRNPTNYYSQTNGSAAIHRYPYFGENYTGTDWATEYSDQGYRIRALRQNDGLTNRVIYYGRQDDWGGHAFFVSGPGVEEEDLNVNNAGRFVFSWGHGEREDYSIHLLADTNNVRMQVSSQTEGSPGLTYSAVMLQLSNSVAQLGDADFVYPAEIRGGTKVTVRTNLIVEGTLIVTNTATFVGAVTNKSTAVVEGSLLGQAATFSGIVTANSNLVVLRTNTTAYLQVTEGAAAGKILGALDSAGNITTLKGDWSMISGNFHTNSAHSYFDNFVVFQNDVTFESEQVTFAGSLVVPLDHSVGGTFAADGPSIFSGAVSLTPRNVTGSIVDASLGNVFFKTLGANIDLAVSNMVSGQTIMLMVTNPAAYTVSWPQFNATNFNDTVMPVATTNGTTFYWFTKIGTATNGFFLGKSYRVVYSTGLTSVTNAEAGTITLTSSGGGSGISLNAGVGTNTTFYGSITNLSTNGSAVYKSTFNTWFPDAHNGSTHLPYSLGYNVFAAGNGSVSNYVWFSGLNPNLDGNPVLAGQPSFYEVWEDNYSPDAGDDFIEWYLRTAADLRPIMVVVNKTSGAYTPTLAGAWALGNANRTTNYIQFGTEGANSGFHSVLGALTISGTNASGVGARPFIALNDRGYQYFHNTDESVSYFLGGHSDEKSFGIFGDQAGATNVIITNFSSGPMILQIPRGGLEIGPGSATVTNLLTATASLNFPDTAAQTHSDLPITVTGTTTNDVPSVAWPWQVQMDGGSYSCFPSNDTVWVRFVNSASTARNPAAGTFRATVTKFR
jgi:hypothetical protein